MKHILIVFLFSILCLAIPDTVKAQDVAPRQELWQKKFSRKMKAKNVVLLDVRTAEEYNEGHLPNAMLLDFQKADFAQKLDSLDKSKTYLIYCKSGRRSKKALELFNKQGFPHPYHLKGGYTNWKGKTNK